MAATMRGEAGWGCPGPRGPCLSLWPPLPRQVRAGWGLGKGEGLVRGWAPTWLRGQPLGLGPCMGLGEVRGTCCHALHGYAGLGIDMVVVNICEAPSLTCRRWSHEPGRLVEWLEAFHTTQIRFHGDGWNNYLWIFSFLLNFCPQHGNSLVVPAYLGNC
jgi:hypothetical protein